MTTYETFAEFIDEQDALFRKLDSDLSERETVLARMVKIGEEFGELCDAVMAAQGNQRKNKLATYAEGDLASECADVLITVHMLAKCLDINILDALEKKMEVIRTKHNKQLG